MASVIGAIVVYAGSFGAETAFTLLYNLFHQSWLLAAPVIAPALAYAVMIMSGQAFPDAPSRGGSARSSCSATRWLSSPAESP